VTVPDHVYEGIVHLIAAQSGWTDEASDEYAAALADCTHRDAFLEAITGPNGIIRTWPELWRPPVSAILEAYHAELARRHPALPRTNVHCDGNGWLPDADGGYRPCARCNPAWHDVWLDRGRWDEAVARSVTAAARLEHLDVGVDVTRGVLRWVGSPPPRCGRAPELPARHDGALARLQAGYAAQCAEQGRTGNLTAALAGLGRERPA
jgi:hypothetical protein